MTQPVKVCNSHNRCSLNEVHLKGLHLVISITFASRN